MAVVAAGDRGSLDLSPIASASCRATRCSDSGRHRTTNGEDDTEGRAPVLRCLVVHHLTLRWAVADPVEMALLFARQ